MYKNTIKAGGSTATKMWTGWMDGWVMPLRLLRLLEHLAVLKTPKVSSLSVGWLVGDKRVGMRRRRPCERG